MDLLGLLPEIISFVVGGGLVTLITLRSTHKRASEEAKSVEVANVQNLLETNQKYIVEPLIREIDGLRKDIECFRCAVSKIVDCSHAAECPVLDELQKRRGDTDRD